MGSKRLGSLVVIVCLIIASVLLALILTPPEHRQKKVRTDVEEHTGVGVLELYFKDRYGCSVQSYLYYPSTYGYRSPPAQINGGYSTIVFGCGYKGDNSIYEWIALNLTRHGYVVFMPDFVNNTSPWAETTNGWITGLYCDTYGANSTLPLQYSGSNELWPDVWPWVFELVDSANFLINASKNNYAFHNGNTTIELGGLIDEDRLAVMGHSTGGSMALVAAMVHKWFKLAIAFAPYDNVLSSVYWPPYPSDFMIHQHAVPILLLVGSRDVLTPIIPNAEHIYSEASTPKMLVDIFDGNHIYFCDSEDIFNSNIILPEELPLTKTPLNIATQQTIAVNITTHFLDYYFQPPIMHSPYAIPDDMDGDEKADINKSYEIGEVIKFVETNLNNDLSYTILADVVPVGIGWANSSVNARFYDLLNRETSFSPIQMEYIFGDFQDPSAGMFKCRVTQKSYYFIVEATSTTGIEYRSELENLIS
jgi:dienelactone hydrolase